MKNESEKPVYKILEDVCNDICDNFCKYSNTCNESGFKKVMLVH